MTSTETHDDTDEVPFLDTVEGEITFFRSVMRARPVGIHRHFHVLAICNAIHRETGHQVSADDIWEKLRSCYDLDILENIEADGYETPGNKGSPAIPIRSPSPTENLFIHPYFRQEFNLPHDETVESLIATRRVRSTASLPSSSPAASPVHHEKLPVSSRGNKKGKNRLKNMAGLVGGDSDSSALTQESGDESISPIPRTGSVATGTDAGTEYAEEEDAEGKGNSPEPLAKVRKTSKSSKKASNVSRTKSGTGTRSSTTKKRKR
ncbi:hypothetical protein NLI96_g8980 [Meripilus lineatus]|uniref:Chromatin modification-related protein EAF7 n=1 Tax=Meripilus lineatus TaxID=2056292 RepID=A0AAD5YAP4_9APHY|nr:hypothetical protein NLI96_g8980 [Physisporinus lineatus]